MQPRTTINEINTALKNPPKVISGEDSVSLESYYRQQAENALAALIGAEAAMGKWQDALAKTQYALADVTQELVNEVAAHAISKHQLKEISEEPCTVQTWVRPSDPSELPFKELVKEISTLDPPRYANVVRNSLLRLHKLLAVRKASTHRLTPTQEMVLSYTQAALDEVYAARGMKWKSKVPCACKVKLVSTTPRKSRTKAADKDETQELKRELNTTAEARVKKNTTVKYRGNAGSARAGMVRWYDKHVSTANVGWLMAKNAYKHYVKFLAGTTYSCASKKVFYDFLDEHFAGRKQRTPNGNVYQGVNLTTDE